MPKTAYARHYYQPKVRLPPNLARRFQRIFENDRTLNMNGVLVAIIEAWIERKEFEKLR